MSLKNKYPYGYMQTSNSNLLDGNGDLNGSAFYVPAYCNQCFLDLLSTNNEATYSLQRHNGATYVNAGTLTPGEETQVEIQAGDLLRFVVSGSGGDELYSYAVGLRDDLEDYSSSVSSSSSTVESETSSVSSSSVSSSSESSSSVSSSSLSKSSSSDLYDYVATLSGSGKLGYSISVDSDNRMVVGAYEDDEVHIYEYDDATEDWILQQTLTNPTGESGERFGWAVDVSGERIIVGAPYAGTYGFSNNGVVYIYQRDGTTGYGTWVLEASISPSNRDDNDYFGYSVAILNTKAVIGAPGRSTGYVYVYDYSSEWSATTYFTGDGSMGDFGASVDLNSQTIMVGDPYHDSGGENAGAIFFFLISGYGQLNRYDGENSYDYFGRDVAMTSSYSVASAPGNSDGGTDSGKIYVYRWDGFDWIFPTGWGLNGANSEKLSRVAIYSDRIVAGGYKYNTGRGRAKVFRHDGGSPGSWSLDQTISPTTSNLNQYFGWDVAIYDNILPVARYIYNEVNIHQRTAIELSSTAELTSSSTSSVSSSSTLVSETSSSSGSSSVSSASSSSLSSSVPPGFDDPRIDEYHDTLSAYWKFEETGTNARLDSHHSHDLTSSGATVGTRAGINNNGCDFDDSDSDYLYVADDVELSPTESMAISLWFQLDDTSPPSGNYVIIDKTNSFGIYYNQDGVNDTDLTFYIVEPDLENRQIENITISDTNWHHAVLIADGTNLYAYLDGASQGSVVYDGVINDTTNILSIGRRSGSAVYYLDGGVDEVGLWDSIEFANATKRQDFVDALYNGGSGKFYEVAEAGFDTSSLSSFSDVFVGALLDEDYVNRYTSYDKLEIVPLYDSSDGDAIIYQTYNANSGQNELRCLSPRDTSSGRPCDDTYYVDTLVLETVSTINDFGAVSCASDTITVIYIIDHQKIVAQYSTDLGVNWHEIITLSVLSGLNYISVENISGNPAYAVSHSSSYSHYQRASSSSGDSWSYVISTFGLFPGNNCSIDLLENVYGNPAIVLVESNRIGWYYGNSTNTINFSDAVISYSHTSDKVSGGYKDGLPFVIVFDPVSNELQHYYCSAATGNGRWYQGSFSASSNAYTTVKSIGETHRAGSNIFENAYVVWNDGGTLKKAEITDDSGSYTMGGFTSLFPYDQLASASEAWDLEGTCWSTTEQSYAVVSDTYDGIAYTSSSYQEVIDSLRTTKRFHKGCLASIGDKLVILYGAKTDNRTGIRAFVFNATGDERSFVFPYYNEQVYSYDAGYMTALNLERSHSGKDEMAAFVGNVSSGEIRYWMNSSVEEPGEGWSISYRLVNNGYDGAMSACLVNNRPAIAYIGTSDHVYFKAVTRDNTYYSSINDWDGDEDLEVTADSGYAIVLREAADSNPMMIYRRSGEIYFNKRETQGWTETIIPDATNALYYDMELFDGIPAVIFYSTDTTDLRCVLALDADGSAWDDAYVIDSASANVGQRPSISFQNNLPTVFYRDVTNENLKFCRATSISGTSFANPSAIYTTGSAAEYLASTTLDGDPVVFFTDGSGRIRYEKFGPITNLSSSSSSQSSQTNSESSSEEGGFQSYTINQYSSNLQAYWSFDENTTDISPNSYDLTNSSAALDYTSGAYYSAVVFDSSVPTYVYNNSSAPSLTDEITISCWAEIANQSDTLCMIEMTKLDKVNILLNYDGSTDTMIFSVRENGGTSLQSATLSEASRFFDSGQFHHIVAVATGTALKLYIDNVERASGSYDGSLADCDEMKMGLDEDENFSDGYLDEMALWTSITFADDGVAFVDALYNSGDGDFYRR